MNSRFLPRARDPVSADRTLLHTPEPTPDIAPVSPTPDPPGSDVTPPAIDDPGPLEHPVPISEPPAAPPPARAAAPVPSEPGRPGSLRVPTRRASVRRLHVH
jgi:hypothetical protein